ncbi:hypothetical protein [Virgibacillus oceani]|uniref:Lipoprotein n=1 Tax=Virgibacillus oceani TaxID=1479511 RepID=A0A917M7G4_9BACI|nr:hypothetical protein [Virgibacillus oceani]GGG82322.1 hypothetical protein GCM10011398_29780 [Virgibacillus oceani]
MKQKVKIFIHLSIYIMLLFILVSCDNNSVDNKNSIEKDVQTTSKNSSQEENKNNHLDNDNKMDLVSTWDHPIKEDVYNISESCESKSLIAPDYTDENVIVFIQDLNEKDRIIEFSRTDMKCKVLYETKGIGNMTGTDGKLFWTEYDTRSITNVDWKIKSYDFENHNVKTVRTGKSYKDTPPPTVRANNSTVNWIEYTTTNSEVISQLVKLDLNSNEPEILSKATLHETVKQKGEYFIIQQGIKNGVLLYKSIFKNDQKNFDISLYSNKGNHKSYIQKDKILDFTSNEKFFVYTGEGYLKAKSHDSNNDEIIYSTDNLLTVDSPILFGDHYIIFRFAMNDVYIGDLRKKIYYKLTKNNSIVSKPIENNGLVSFATRDKNEITKFHVLNLKEIN